MLLIPLLRLAYNLTRSPDHRIRGVDCRLRDGEVVLQVSSNSDIDLEQWAAERTGEIFQQIYSRPMSVVKSRE
jgi:hypothetical protein